MVDYCASFFLYCSIVFHANVIQFTNKGKSLNIVWDGCDKRLQNLSPGSVVRATQGKKCISKWLKPISSHMPILKDHALQPSHFKAIGLRSNAVCIVFIKLEDYIVFNISQGTRTIFFLEGMQSYITKNIYLKYILNTEEEMNTAKTVINTNSGDSWNTATYTLSVCHHPLWLTKEFWKSYDSKTVPKWQKFSHSDLKEEE